MTSVHTLPPRVPDIPAEVSRIRRLSRPMIWLFTALLAVVLVVLVGAVLTALFYDGPRVQLRPGGLWVTLPPDTPTPGGQTLASLPVHIRSALAASATLMLAPAAVILECLRRLFALYAQGAVLEARNARCIGHIGLALIAYAVAPTLGHLLVSAAGFDDAGWLRLDSLQALVAGAVLLIVARVMRWGADVHDDASRFV